MILNLQKMISQCMKYFRLLNSEIGNDLTALQQPNCTFQTDFRLLNSEIGNDLAISSTSKKEKEFIFVSLTRR